MLDQPALTVIGRAPSFRRRALKVALTPFLGASNFPLLIYRELNAIACALLESVENVRTFSIVVRIGSNLILNSTRLELVTASRPWLGPTSATRGHAS